MVRTSSVASVLLFAATTLTLSSAHLEYTIRVRNLTFGQPFSPVFFIAHAHDITPFIEGAPANDFMKEVAETGIFPDIETVLEEEGITQYVCGFVLGSAGVMPGETERLTLTVDEDICEGGGRISMVSMLVNTNDAFVGIDSEKLETRGSSTIFPPAWDAGTEDNNELCTHIPGPACSGTAGNEEAGPGEGYIHTHRGVHGVSGELPSATYTWLNPVAEVYIAKPTQL